MPYWGLENDGTYSIANEETLFIQFYEKNWKELLADTYYKTELLSYGHKLRPRLVYWGFRAGEKSQLEEKDFDAVSKVAISIELVHKTSELLDDYIDGDTARHGMESFHITYGPERTMIFSLNILCRALKIINNVFIDYIDDSIYSKLSIKLIVQTLEDMTLGVLRELDLHEDIDMIDMTDIQEIMHLETASLITNSLLVGFLLSQNTDEETVALFTEIGTDLGYIFQTLNDLEPFCSKKNNDHKGSLNTDISRNRKNVCIPFLYIYLTSREKKELAKYSAKDRDSFLLELFEKYSIKEKLLKEISNVMCNIHTNIDKISPQAVNTIWIKIFHHFVDYIIKVSEKRLK
ncbi:MAG: polyprenyl synthetase family protein [Lachnospiraceae bacterium]|nr:polyprenyl synthetase family protein [Lachnospiraceae bacterium]